MSVRSQSSERTTQNLTPYSVRKMSQEISPKQSPLRSNYSKPVKEKLQKVAMSFYRALKKKEEELILR